MDGVDLACCELTWEDQQWDYHILKAETFPYGDELLKKLEQACHWSMDHIHQLDLELGVYFADLLNTFHKGTGLYPDFIASHGHTILHDPKKGITYQAGNGQVMAEKTGIKVVNDFRSEDVAQGGEGAPLVPLGDRLLFFQYEGCLNLGGFANISFENSRGQQVAYDLSPANMSLNAVAALDGLAFDRDGMMARSGRVDQDLFEKLNSLEFYAETGPKSLGREWFLETFHPFIRSSKLDTPDLMATVLEHIAFQIARGINDAGIQSLLISGGGALNQTLVDRIKTLTGISLEIPEEKLIHYKEALIFALLGTLRIRGEINCLASVTGGEKDLSTGKINYT